MDRLERVAMLLVRAGVRARSELRERDRDLEKRMSHLVDLQIANEDLQKQNQKKFAESEERFARDEIELAALSRKTDQRFAELAESQAQTDRSLAELIKIVRTGRNGNPQSDS